jgi:predicted nucleic acid-binding protein
MNAVSNTTPLRYLIAIKHEDLLGKLFDRVIVAIAVHKELSDARTPEIVARFVMAPPAWFDVRAVQETTATSFPVSLHRG